MKIYNSITKLTYLDKKLENGNGTIGRLRTDTDHDSKAILLPKGGILADELSTRQSSGGTIESSEFSRERTTEGTPGPVTGECKTVSTTDPIKYLKTKNHLSWKCFKLTAFFLLLLLF